MENKKFEKIQHKIKVNEKIIKNLEDHDHKEMMKLRADLFFRKWAQEKVKEIKS